jgi:hypothetical protein
MSLFFLCNALLMAAQPIRMQIDRTTFGMHETAHVQIEVSGNAGEPELPPCDCTLQFAGKQSAITWINGKNSQQATYHYLLRPHKPGPLHLGPFTVTDAKQQQWQTQALQLQITPAATTPNAPVNPTGEAQRVFSEVLLNKTEAYVGEQVGLIWRFYYASPVQNTTLNWPGLEELGARDVGDKQEFETERHGVRYRVIQIKKAFFPVQAGALKIPSSVLELDLVQAGKRNTSPFGMFNHPFDDFFDSGEITLHQKLTTPAYTLNIKPLPPLPDDMVDFDGSVGQFKMKVTSPQLARTKHIGDPFTQHITIEGDSDDVHLIPLTHQEGEFQIFEDSPQITSQVQGDKLYYTTRIQRTFIPQQVGESELPPPRFIYFDPQQARYVELKGDAQRLTLKHHAMAQKSPTEKRSGANPVSPTPSKKAAPTPSSSAVATWTPHLPLAPTWLYRVFFWLPPALFLTGLLYRKRTYAMRLIFGKHWLAKQRFYQALKQLKKADSLQKNGDFQKAAAICEAVLRGFLYEHASEDSRMSTLTPDELAKWVHQQTEDDHLAKDMHQWLTLCDAVIYGHQKTTLAIERLADMLQQFHQYRLRAP